jgi:hypothetical protein
VRRDANRRELTHSGRWNRNAWEMGMNETKFGGKCSESGQAAEDEVKDADEATVGMYIDKGSSAVEDISM